MFILGLLVLWLGCFGWRGASVEAFSEMRTGKQPSRERASGLSRARIYAERLCFALAQFDASAIEAWRPILRE